jgi:hypothetical protein
MEKLSARDRARVVKLHRARVRYDATKKKGRKHVEFSLTEEDVECLITGVCHYCGAPPSERRITLYDGKVPTVLLVKMNGIDRYDNPKGFTLENSVSCCWDCNDKKGVLHGDYFLWRSSRVFEVNVNLDSLPSVYTRSRRKAHIDY